MLLCVTCGEQKPNRYKPDNCPKCGAYLKYVEAPAKATVIKLHKADLSVSYASAEVYSYNSYAVHMVNICIGLAKPYQAEVLRRLPNGYGYVLPHSYSSICHIPPEQLQSPVCTYGLIRYEVPYLDNAEAKVMLKHKLKELDAWIDEAVSDGWFAVCNLAGPL